MNWLFRAARRRSSEQAPCLGASAAQVSGERLARLIDEQQAELFARLVRARARDPGELHLAV